MEHLWSPAQFGWTSWNQLEGTVGVHWANYACDAKGSNSSAASIVLEAKLRFISKPVRIMGASVYMSQDETIAADSTANAANGRDHAICLKAVSVPVQITNPFRDEPGFLQGTIHGKGSISVGSLPLNE